MFDREPRPLSSERLVRTPRELDQFISGGYYLAEPVPRPPSFSRLLPETIVSLSPCLAEVGPTHHSDDAMPFGFSSFQNAIAAHTPPQLLLGIVLHTSLLPSLRRQRDRDINRGYGLLERVGEHQPLAGGGIVLGFEPLGFEAMSFHSWLCNYFPDNVRRDLCIVPASNGFIEDFSDSQRVTTYIISANGEPAIWLPWLVVEYGGANRIAPGPAPTLR